MVPISPEKAPVGPEKAPIRPEKARFSRSPIFSENLGLKPPFVSPRLDFPNSQILRGISPKLFAALRGIHPYLCTPVLPRGHKKFGAPFLSLIERRPWERSRGGAQGCCGRPHAGVPWGGGVGRDPSPNLGTRRAGSDCDAPDPRQAPNPHFLEKRVFQGRANHEVQTVN